MRVIDVDSHFHEPVDWLSHANPSLAAELPPPGRFMDQLRAMHAMQAAALPEDIRPEEPLDLMTAEFRKHCEKTDQLQPDRYEPDGDDPYYTGAARIALCDRLGVDAQFISPTFGTGLTLQAMGAGRMDLIPRLQAAWNTFAADQLAGYTDRLMPVTQTFLSDVDWTVAEMTRMRELGSRAFHLSQHQAKSLTHPDFDQMWSAAEDLGMAGYVHVSFGQPPSHPSWVNNGRGLSAFHKSIGNADFRGETRNLLTTMVFDGVFEAHPELKMILAESATSWLPWYLHEIDHRTTKVAMDGLAQDNFYDLALLPSEYIQRQVRIAALIGFTDTRFEHIPLRDLFEMLPSPDMVVYSSDWPHVEGRQDAVTAFDKHLPDDDTVRESFYGRSIAEFLDI